MPGGFTRDRPTKIIKQSRWRAAAAALILGQTCVVLAARVTLVNRRALRRGGRFGPRRRVASGRERLRELNVTARRLCGAGVRARLTNRTRFLVERSTRHGTRKESRSSA